MNILKKFFLGIISVIILLLAAEGMARIFFDPTDYLWRRLVPDETLRHRVEPNTRGHDSWGFRNKQLPEQAYIVALGDSQTYGTSSLAKHSWPKLLGGLRGQQVYNMSLGGYGPAEFFYLMEDKALVLEPKIIISGFYLGNDLTDTYEAVYGVSHWDSLRNPELDSAKKEISSQNQAEPQGQNQKASLMNRIYLIADWFAGNSVLYRIANTSSLGDSIRQKRVLESGVEVVMLEDSENNIKTGFMPDALLKNLDLNNPEVSEGLRLSLQFYKQMNELAEMNGIEFLVVIIPTKESVLSEFIEANSGLPNSRQIEQLIESEKEINEIVKTYFMENGIAYIDVLEPLQSAVKNEQLYPNNYSSHPNKNGNRVIAETINHSLEGNLKTQ